VRQTGIVPIRTGEGGAIAVLHLALRSDPAPCGLYLDEKEPARARAQAYDLTARERLHEVSLQCVFCRGDRSQAPMRVAVAVNSECAERAGSCVDMISFFG
jgi:hypothetical protein